jgi:leader peptidase (prepilin peptidase)/N-methyltransferase
VGGAGSFTDVTALLAVVCGIVGLLIGSFLNVVIYRVPRKESVVKPRSHCPSCGTELRSIDNIPVLSWLALRGRCHTCGAPISVRYPLVELATGALFTGAAVRFGASWEVPAFCLFLAASLALALIDLEHFLLPNRVIYPTLLGSVPLLLLAAVGEDDWHALRDAVIGCACAFAFFFLLNLVYPRGMAFGDVRFSAVLGLYLGWLGPGSVFVGLLFGFFSASIVGVGLILAKRANRRSPIPFGVFLAFGAMVTVFFGRPILHWYLHRSPD